MNEIYIAMMNMKLHEIIDLNEITSIIRVPGGWIYIVETNNEGTLPHAMTSTFVPYINEEHEDD